MPYGNDEWLEKLNAEHRERERTWPARHRQMIREDLMERFKVPDEFIELAITIWLDGKTD